MRNNRSSAAGHAHMTADARPIVAAINNEIVALGLEADGAVDRCTQEIVIGRGAERLAQIGGIFLTEAGMKRARAGNADPVAGLAEVMGHWRDETESAAGFRHADIAGGTTCAVGKVGKREARRKPGADQ